MKLKYLLSAAMLSAAMTASAVPAYPGLIQRTLEDGTTVNVRLHGDEYFNYMTDEQGYMLIQNGQTLNYKMSNGSKVMATEALIEQMRVETEAAAPVQKMRQAAMQRMATLDRYGRTTFPTTGDVHFLILLVQYDDVKFNSPTIREDMDAMLNQKGYSKNGCHGSMRDYYIESSNGKFTPTFDVAPVVTLPKTSLYYTGGHKYDNVSEMVTEAMALADPNVDYSKYCYQTPGVCDAVIIFYAGYGQADTSDTSCIWPHQSTVFYNNIYHDDTRMGVYCCFNELNGGDHYRNKDGALAGIGTPIHEFGHVMGMPDLYDPAYKVSSTPSYWSIFDMGPYLGDGYCPPTCSAYERWLFNWLEFEEAVDGTQYSLEELNENNRAVRISTRNSTTGDLNSNEYFVLESRNNTGWDEYLPGHGMLIWHIDYNNTYWKNNTVNSTETRKRCHIISADGSANYFIGRNDRTSANAAWPYGTLNYLTPDTEITLNSFWVWENVTGHSYITNMAFDPETGVSTFDYNILTATPDDVTVMAAPTRGIDSRGDANNDITFTWQPVEGATGYLLTVYRQSGNKIYYEGDLNEFNVGMATEYTIPSLSRTKMGLEYHAYVRVINEIPSSEKSNELVFVPNNLEAVVGIDAVEGENIRIIGLDGAIQAPAGAEIYNMQGVRCAAQGLAPGVYVVRYGNTVTKAVVR